MFSKVVPIRWINYPILYIICIVVIGKMSVIIKHVVKETSGMPKIAIGILLTILISGMFVVGYDQGQLAQAIFVPIGIHLNHDQLMLIHEFNHDLRHAAGFPCH
jgi:ABC-type tungstate transport system substrate-binding protein